MARELSCVLAPAIIVACFAAVGVLFSIFWVTDRASTTEQLRLTPLDGRRYCQELCF